MASRTNKYLRSKSKKILHNATYTESSGFPPGVLPTNTDVIESMIYLMRPDRAGEKQRNVDDAAKILGYALRQQWEYCTVYTIQIEHIKKKIVKHYEEFRFNIQTRVQKRNQSWMDRMVIYNAKNTELFDIYCKDEKSRKSREEEIGGVEMGEAEYT